MYSIFYSEFGLKEVKWNTKYTANEKSIISSSNTNLKEVFRKGEHNRNIAIAQIMGRGK